MAKNLSTYKRESEEKLQNVNDWLNPGEKKGKGNEKPYYATGARCFIKMGGTPVGICQDFKWTIGYNSTPTMTVDTVFPWDIDVGPVNISATLSKILDPLKGPEAENLFPIMAAAVHQPMVELQVIYNAVVVTPSQEAKNTLTGAATFGKIGETPARAETQELMEFSMFFARGMFTSVSSNATLGQLSYLSASFTGVAYQHYVSQAYTPYGFSYIAQEVISDLREAAGLLSGGFV